MPDNGLPPLPPGFTLDAQPSVAPSGAITLGTPRPKEPAPQTPAQAEKDQLEVEKMKRDLAKTPETDPALAQSIKNLGLEEWLTNVDRARDQLKTGFATGVLGSIAGHFPGTPRQDFLGALQGIKGASILEKLQALREQSKNGSSGMGSLTEQEGERLANSIASLSDTMSAKELSKSLDIVERHAKALQAIGAGKNPEDPAVQQEFGILPLPGEKPAEAAPPPPENPLANGGDDQGPSLTPSAGETRSVIDPKKQALGAKIVGLAAKGADFKTLMGFAVGADPSLRNDPRFRAWAKDAVQYHKQHPGAKFGIDPSFYTTEVPLSLQEKVGNAVAQSSPGAAAMNAANAVTAGNLGAITGDTEGVDRALAVANAQHPTASLLGTLGGGTTATLGLEGLLARLGMAPGLLRGTLADTGFGAATGISPDGETDMPGRIANGALYGLGGSLAGQGLLKVPGAALRGVTNPTVSYVAKEGVPLTIGQAVGGKMKGIEDTLSGIRVVGDTINARRLEGLQKMNSAAFDRALEPIGGKVGGKFGEEAVRDAQDQVGDAFSKALSGKSADVDPAFMADATKAMQSVRKIPRIGEEVAQQIEEMGVGNPGSLAITGENMQALLRSLQQIKTAYRGDPLAHQVNNGVSQVEAAVEGLFQRQAPEVMPQYKAAKQAFRRLSVLEDAVNRAKNESKDGNAIFTTGQLGLADRGNTVKFGGKSAAAAGKGEFHDFQRNMQEVLPNKVPDSGTAGRVLLPLALVGAGGGAGELSGETQTGLTLGGLLALAYTKGGQKLLAGKITGRSAKAQAIGKALSKYGRITGAAGAAKATLGPPGD